jgi:hypothetical protein
MDPDTVLILWSNEVFNASLIQFFISVKCFTASLPQFFLSVERFVSITFFKSSSKAYRSYFFFKLLLNASLSLLFK